MTLKDFLVFFSCDFWTFWIFCMRKFLKKKIGAASAFANDVLQTIFGRCVLQFVLQLRFASVFCGCVLKLCFAIGIITVLVGTHALGKDVVYNADGRIGPHGPQTFHTHPLIGLKFIKARKYTHYVEVFYS